MRQEEYSPLLRSLGPAQYWRQLLDDGKFKSITDFAAAEVMDMGRASRVSKLAQLSPAITLSVLAGTDGTWLRCQVP